MSATRHPLPVKAVFEDPEQRARGGASAAATHRHLSLGTKSPPDSVGRPPLDSYLEQLNGPHDTPSDLRKRQIGYGCRWLLPGWVCHEEPGEQTGNSVPPNDDPGTRTAAYEGHWLVRFGFPSDRISLSLLAISTESGALVASIEPPYLHGLVVLRHRLASVQLEKNRLRLVQVARASARLTPLASPVCQCGSEQAEPPRMAIPEGSSTTSELRSLPWSQTA